VFTNYLKIAFRNLWRNRFFSGLNILGLSLGLACSLLIILWVRSEKNIDAFHEHGDRLYRIYERQYHDGQVDAGFYTPGQLAAEMKKVIPEVECSSGFAWEDETTFQVGDKILKEKGNHADSDYFRMFSYPLLRGTAQTALNTPLSIAISRKMAYDFFGSPEKAMGKTVRFESRKDLNVSAVFEDLGDDNSEKFDYLISWQAFLEDNKWAKEWGNNGPQTLLMLRKDADPLATEAKIRKFLVPYNKEMDAKFWIELGMQKFGETYLHSNFKNGRITGGRIEYVRLFSIIAIFILLIACVNFMNLTTARSVRRAKEIGIRKVSGAIRPVLIRQFLGEALLITAIAVIFSLILVLAFLPAFRQMTDKDISIPWTWPQFWLGLMLITGVTGFVAGSYPALFLSSFQPIKVLKGSMKFSTGATWFRKGLVVFQFTLSIILIIGTIIVSRQINFVQGMNLGYDRENLVYIPLEGDLRDKFDLFKSECSRIPGVRQMTRISANPTNVGSSTGGVQWEGKDPNSAPQFTTASVGYDFIRTMNIQLVAGRDYSHDFATDSVGYLLNESALRLIGFQDPVGKPLTFWEHHGTIIGVMKDFHFQSLHEPIKPLILRLAQSNDNSNMLVRVDAARTRQALDGLAGISKKLNPNFPFAYKFVDEEYQKLYASEAVVRELSRWFAGLGIFICCLGLLGLAMFTAEQRKREISIRKVLGAGSASLFTLLSRDFVILVLLAFVIATPLAWWAMNSWLQNFYYRTPVSWWIFAVAGIMAILIALFTVSLQAVRAVMTNPTKSLRSE
jgi:putative ABC transport system permease protein